MEIEYDKAALQEYLSQIESIREQMHRRQDESLNLYNSCKQKYTRIYTKLEEVAHKAYNQMENAESMRRSAEIELETATRIAENSENKDTISAAMKRIQQAQIMQVEAGEEYIKASSAYEEASGNLKELSKMWDENAPILESQFSHIEECMISFLRLVDNGNSDLDEYMNIMDKARAALYGDSGEGTGSNDGLYFERTVSTAGARGGMTNNSRKIADSSVKSKLGNTVGIVVAANGLKSISMSVSVSGKSQTFPVTKSGIAKAHRNALKNGDSELASYTKQMFYEMNSSNELSMEETASSTQKRINKIVNVKTASVVGSSQAIFAHNNQVAAALVDHGLVYQADFGKLDNWTAQDIYKSVSETLKMFPGIDLHFVGSLQSRNQRIAKRLEEMYLEAYRQHYPMASDDDLMPFVRQQVSEDMKGFDPSEQTIAQSLFIENPQTHGENLIAEFNGISINERYGGDYNYFTDIRKRDVKAKWKPVGCDSPRATVDHELGHQIARITNAHNDVTIQEMYYEFKRLNNAQQGEVLSGYAGKSIHEFIAEGWSEYRNNPNCRTLAKNIATRLFDLYNQSNLSS